MKRPILPEDTYSKVSPIRLPKIKITTQLRESPL